MPLLPCENFLCSKFCPQKVKKLRNFTALYLKHVVINFFVPFLKQNSQQDTQQRLETTILQQMKTARFDFDDLPPCLSLDALCDRNTASRLGASVINPSGLVWYMVRWVRSCSKSFPAIVLYFIQFN